MTIRAAVTAMAIASTLAIAGCGLGAGPGTSNVSVTVTRDFGSRSLGAATETRAPGSETVMRMLQRHFRVGTRYGGGFVQSIDGLSGSSAHLDWFYYVNGVEAGKGAAVTAVDRGDQIWWDLHDWSATDSIPAVVGSFPEPFLRGVGGRRLPTTIECAADASKACASVSSALGRLGVPAATQLIGAGGSGTDSLAVVVGTWRDLRGEILAGLIAQGPGSSGVYARFAGPGGSALQLLDPRGTVVRTLGAGAGLVAATAQGSAEPTWLITGTDLAGVTAAARALNPAALRDHFAVAVQGSSDFPLPLQGQT
ncbi:MAG TPA: DUF4430 domain-containing protein [Solirubrobacteraceae bacterium]|nr:DUF4430 domain-containing protein [Solirubrobacteraceae bacterium]